MSERSKLYWRCRRGMKELDIVMLSYLDSRYDDAPEAERRAFERLLELQDPELYGYVIGREAPVDPELADVVRRLVAGVQARD